MLLRAVKQREGRLVLCGLSPFVAEVFDISNFRALFEVLQDRIEARAALAQTEA
jgi:anti-anti-sigma regulatory factor